MVDRESLLEDGYKPEEIDMIDAYCEKQDRLGRFDTTATPILHPNGRLQLVCRTVAVACTYYNADCHIPWDLAERFLEEMRKG